MVVQERIENAIKRKGGGKVHFPSDFQDKGRVEAVKKALLRLEKKGMLQRLGHGIYLYPKVNKTVGRVRPSMDEVAHAIAKRDRATIIPTGAQAMNKLGLSAQVPMNVVYLTDGSPRNIRIGNRSLKFKRVAPRNLAAKGPISKLVIQAMKAIGKRNLSDQRKKKLREVLQQEDPKNVKHDAELAPAWIREFMLSALG